MRHVRWLNPLTWFWGLYIAFNAAYIVFWGAGTCDECEMTARGEPLPWENLCEYHQERLRALSNEGVEDYWREWYG